MTTIEKIWVYPVAIYAISLMMLILVDGLIGIWAFFFDMEPTNFKLLMVIIDQKWFWKLLIGMVMYSWIMFCVVTLTYGKVKK